MNYLRNNALARELLDYFTKESREIVSAIDPGDMYKVPIVFVMKYKELDKSNKDTTAIDEEKTFLEEEINNVLIDLEKFNLIKSVNCTIPNCLPDTYIDPKSYVLLEDKEKLRRILDSTVH